MKPKTKLSTVQINRRMNVLRAALKEANVRPGWIRYMREALGMTLKNLAERAHAVVPTVAQAERREAEGKVTIATLKEMARAMDCEFVYAFIPKTGIDEIQQRAALEKARKLLRNADTHMVLEDQKVTEDFEERVAHLAAKLRERGDVW